ncbi:hypothetical protein [Natrinema salsiterrestre]|uniref:hypothetical protein n=1 Tax=Natrinema salsiterrestre TaxID=2950540 RepID=UPI0027D94750|nr:hypothetical protein [Natrinema salsiterrestre]
MTTVLEHVRRRYETTDKKCPDYGYVDEEGNWVSQTARRKLVYRHVCPSCDATGEQTFNLK